MQGGIVTTYVQCMYLVQVYGPTKGRTIDNGHFRAALNLYACIVHAKAFQC